MARDRTLDPKNHVPVFPTAADNGGGVVFGSDIRLKRDIAHLGTLPNGIRLYAFRYLWDDTVHVGVMAQELLARPEFRNAVATMDGYYCVRYDRLGLRMTTLAAWRQAGVAAVVAGDILTVH